jgi:hypothetical protein
MPNGIAFHVIRAYFLLSIIITFGDSTNSHPGLGQAHVAGIDIELHNTPATVIFHPDVVGTTAVMVGVRSNCSSGSIILAFDTDRLIVQHAISNVGQGGVKLVVSRVERDPFEPPKLHGASQIGCSQ